MKKITLELTDDAYQDLRDAIEAHRELYDRELTVREWLQEELNNNTEVIIEMLLEQL